MPVVLVHYREINAVKGLQNRLEYLEGVINKRLGSKNNKDIML